MVTNLPKWCLCEQGCSSLYKHFNNEKSEYLYGGSDNLSTIRFKPKRSSREVVNQQVSILTKLKAGMIHTPFKCGLSIGSAPSFPS